VVESRLEVDSRNLGGSARSVRVGLDILVGNQRQAAQTVHQVVEGDKAVADPQHRSLLAVGYWASMVVVRKDPDHRTIGPLLVGLDYDQVMALPQDHMNSRLRSLFSSFRRCFLLSCSDLARPATPASPAAPAAPAAAVARPLLRLRLRLSLLRRRCRRRLLPPSDPESLALRFLSLSRDWP